jgi:hypothetical protein
MDQDKPWNQEHEHMMGDILEPMTVELDENGTTLFDINEGSYVLFDSKGRCLFMQKELPFPPEDVPENYTILKVVERRHNPGTV